MGIVGHEYTHAISNRMVGGPDEGITSEQGGAMGESWGDLVAGEYMFSHGYPNGATRGPSAPTPPATRPSASATTRIDANPLNYSDYGFDCTGDEVHADGEIWNGTMWRCARRWSKVQRRASRTPTRRSSSRAPRARRRGRRCRPRSARATAAGSS